MRQFIKNNIALFIEHLGLNKFFRNRIRRKILILTYHGVLPSKLIDNHRDFILYNNIVSQDSFRKQMDYLNTYFKPVSLSKLENINELEKSEPEKPFVIITFDDGFENTYRYALPILCDYGIVGHFFIPTCFIGSRKLLWSEEINYRLLKTGLKDISLAIGGTVYTARLDSLKNRVDYSVMIRNILKSLHSQDIDATLKLVQDLTCDVDIEQIPSTRYKFLSWEQIQELVEMGMIIGSHSSSHYLLSGLSDEEAFDSILNSKKEIEGKTKSECKYFSYPNGRLQDFGERDIKLLKKLGFKFAVSQIPGFNSISDLQNDGFRLKRLNITNLMSYHIFKAVVSGVWSKISSLH